MWRIFKAMLGKKGLVNTARIALAILPTSGDDVSMPPKTAFRFDVKIVEEVAAGGNSRAKEIKGVVDELKVMPLASTNECNSALHRLISVCNDIQNLIVNSQLDAKISSVIRDSASLAEKLEDNKTKAKVLSSREDFRNSRYELYSLLIKVQALGKELNSLKTEGISRQILLEKIIMAEALVREMLDFFV